TQYLENTLGKQGRLAGQVRLIGAEYHADTNRADVHFNVQPGPLVNVQVKVEPRDPMAMVKGLYLWPWTKHNLLPVYAQIGVNPELIQEGRQNLLSHFQSKGFFNATVRSQVQETAKGQDILYEVVKGPRHKV